MDYREFLEELPGLVGNRLAAPNPPEPGWFAQFLTSALRAGTSELVGLPGQWVQNITGVSPQQSDFWRAQNPVAGVVSQIAGALGPYAWGTSAGLRLGARAFPGLFSAERLATSPISVGAQRGLVAEVPFAAGRTVASAVLGGDVEDVALSAGVDLALGTALGGAAGALWSRRGSQLNPAPPENELSRLVPRYDMSLPAQDRLKAILAMKDAGTAAQGPLAQLIPDVEQQLRRQVRTESPDAIPTVWFSDRPKSETMGLIHDVYDLKRDDITSKRLMESARNGFKSSQEWRDIIAQVGLPNNWEVAIQFPRVVEPKTEQAAKRLRARIENILIPVHDNWFINQTVKPSGMFLIAKPLPGDKNRWFVAFTNRPSAIILNSPILERSDRLGKFFQNIDAMKLNERIEQVGTREPDSVLSVLWKLDSLYKPRVFLPERDKDVLNEIIPQAIKNVAKEYRPLAAKLWRNVKGGLAVLAHQFTNEPLARNLLFKAGAIYDRAKARAASGLYGSDVLENRTVAEAILPGKNAKLGGVYKAFDDLQESDIPALMRVIAEVDPHGLGLKKGAPPDVPFEDALRSALEQVSDDAQARRIAEFIRAAKTAQDEAFRHFNLVREVLELPPIPPLPNRVLPHYWVGTHRWRLIDERGRTVYMASGRNMQELRKNADEAAAKFGLRKDPKGPFVSGQYEDLEEAISLRTSFGIVNQFARPNILYKERRGVMGYMLDPDGPKITKDDLWRIVQSGIEQTEFAAADLLVKNVLGPRLADVRLAYGPEVAYQATRRLQDMSGTQGPFTAWQNRKVEQLFGTGKSGATKLAGNLNRLETAFQLTFLDFGYAAINALTPLITLWPKLTLLKTVPVDQLHRYFDTILVRPDEKTSQFLNIPSALKVMREAFRVIRNPDQEERKLFERAIREHVIAPRFIENEVGLKSSRAVTISRLMRGEDSLFETAMNFVEMPARLAEEFTRAHAFASGIIAGRLAGFKGEALYQFAKELTYRTMYGYASQERARVFQGPIGGVAGLFKNWLLHNIGDWSAYAGEAARRLNFRPLLWVALSTGALAGLGGLPFMQALESFQRLTGNPSIMEALYAGANGLDNPWLADAAWYGLPALLGVSMQSSASAPLNDPTRDIGFLFSIALLDRMQAIGALGLEALNTWRAGASPMQNERVWDRFWYAMTPRSIYRAMAQVENGALKAVKNGAPIYEGVTLGEYAMNVLGFTPLTLARAWEANSRLWEDRERAARMVARLGEVLAQGYVQGNQKLVDRAIAQAVASGVDLSRVMISAQQRVLRQMVPSVPFEYIRDPDRAEFLELVGLLNQ